MIHYNSSNFWGNLEFLDEKNLKQLKVVSGDVQDFHLMNTITKDMDIVFHLAALIAIPFSYVAPGIVFKTNVEGTMNIMQACLNNNVKKVTHASTSEVYGSARYVPIDEQHTLQAQSLYSASKRLLNG